MPRVCTANSWRVAFFLDASFKEMIILRRGVRSLRAWNGPRPASALSSSRRVDICRADHSRGGTSPSRAISKIISDLVGRGMVADPERRLSVCLQDLNLLNTERLLCMILWTWCVHSVHAVCVIMEVDMISQKLLRVTFLLIQRTNTNTTKRNMNILSTTRVLIGSWLLWTVVYCFRLDLPFLGRLGKRKELSLQIGRQPGHWLFGLGSLCKKIIGQWQKPKSALKSMIAPRLLSASIEKSKGPSPRSRVCTLRAP